MTSEIPTKAMGEALLRRYGLGLHRKDGTLCHACGRGSKAGLSYYESPTGGFAAILCWMCAVRLLASMAEMGYDPKVEQVAP